MLRRTLTLAVLLAIAVTPAAAAAPGALDPSFGTGGVALGGAGVLSAGAFDPHGRIITAGGPAPSGSGPIRVSRWTDGGILDTSFGTQGTATFARPGGLATATAIVAAADGAVYVAGGGSGGAYVVRFDAAGVRDGGFGGGGTVELEAEQGGFVTGMVDTPAGLVVAYAPYGTVSARLVRLTPSGALDPAFSGDGRVTTTFDPATLPAAGASAGQALVRRADGTLLLGGIRDGKPAVAAFTDAGAPVAGYGLGGVAELPRGDVYGPVSAIAPAPDGSAFVLDASGVARVSASGALDAGFGDVGHRALSLSAAGQSTLTGLALQPGGGVLVSGSATMSLVPVAALPAPAPGSLYVSDATSPITPADWGVVLTRLDAAGAVDCTYGSYGQTRVLPEGTFEASAATVLLDAAGRALTVGAARGPDYNALRLLTRTATGDGDEPELAVPQVLVGVAGVGYGQQPTFTGWIDPRCGSLTWHFEYGATTAYGTSTEDHGLAAAAGPARVSAVPSGLAAGTYHYRLVTDGPAGRTVSEDATFTMRRAPGGSGGDPRPASHPGRLRLLATSATLRSGRTARFAVRCRDGACKRGTVTLRRGRTTIATGAVSLASGKKGHVTVTLTAAGRRAAGRHRVLSATALLAVAGGTTSRAAVTLRSRASR